MSKKRNKLDEFIESKVIEENLEDILGDRFGRYSKYIIQERALPDVRDGLKPVQRRILYAMYKMGMTSSAPYKKSARIAGEVMGKYHPHGDSSIYDAMVRMSQEWKQGVCLIDMHGNNGSIDGDSAAAMRYTEARLTKEAEALLEDIDKRTVLFIPNFDDEELEPTVLPAKFPNLLVNGASGISAGYATKIPPHNLKEVLLATIRRIDKPTMTVDEVIEIMPGPDFPTGGIVQGKEGIKEAFLTGRGRVIVRSKTEIESISKDTNRIVITEIPYEVNKGDLVKAIDNIRLSRKLEDIAEVRDETDKDGLRIAIDLKRDANVENCLNYLLKNTEMQISFNYNMIAINQQRPVLMGVLDILDSYINHQKEVITNRSNFILNKAEKRLHIVFGLIKMVSILDDVIRTIRASKNKQNSKENLMKKFEFTELQAEAIVTLQLYRLSSTDINALIKEQKDLEKQIEELKEILSSERMLLNLIKKELRAVIRNIGTDRKTEIEEEIEQLKIDKLELISEEEVRVAVTKDGYIKRSSLRSFKASQTIGLKENDALMFDADVSTHDVLLMFTTRGNYIYKPVFELEDYRWGDLGTYINNIIPIDKDEYVIKVFCIKDFDEDTNVLMATKKGKIKQSPLKEYQVSRYSRLIKGMNISKNDELASIDIGTKNNIIVLTKRGQGLRMLQEEVPIYGVQTSGVNALKLDKKDELATALYAKSDDELLIISQRGHIRREKVAYFPLSGRLRATTTLWEDRSRNPHYVMDAARLSKEQKKENARVLVAAKKGYLDTFVKDLKPSVAEYGRPYLSNNKYSKTLFINLEQVPEEPDYELIESLKRLEKERIKREKELEKERELALLRAENEEDSVSEEDETIDDIIEDENIDFDEDEIEEEKPIEKEVVSATETVKKAPEKVASVKKEPKMKIKKLSLFDDWEE
jgi:topoisomerase-4 subunit A